MSKPICFFTEMYTNRWTSPSNLGAGTESPARTDTPVPPEATVDEPLQPPPQALEPSPLAAEAACQLGGRFPLHDGPDDLYQLPRGVMRFFQQCSCPGVEDAPARATA